MINLIKLLQRDHREVHGICAEHEHVWLYPPEMDRRVCKNCPERQIRGYRFWDDRNNFYHSVWLFRPALTKYTDIRELAKDWTDKFDETVYEKKSFGYIEVGYFERNPDGSANESGTAVFHPNKRLYETE